MWPIQNRGVEDDGLPGVPDRGDAVAPLEGHLRREGVREHIQRVELARPRHRVIGFSCAAGLREEVPEGAMGDSRIQARG